MKKLYINLVAALAMVSLSTACGGDAPADDSAKPRRMEYAVSADSLPFPKPIADSLSAAYGYLVGSDNLGRIDTLATPYDKDAFLEGVDVVIADTASSPAYSQGVLTAVNLIGSITELRSKGVEVNIPLLLKGLREGMYTDSVSLQQITQSSQLYNELLVRAMQQSR